MRISKIIFIIGTILLLPALYTILTIVVFVLSFEYIDLYNIINLDEIFRGKDNLFWGFGFWGIISWIVSLIINSLFEEGVK